MRINKINIRNFKGFDYKEIEFISPSFTVLIGENASGKSTVLDAVAIALGTFLIGIDGVQSRSLKKHEIRNIATTPESIEAQLPVVLDGNFIINNQTLAFHRTQQKLRGSLTYKDSAEIIDIARNYTKRIRTNVDTDFNLPLIAYHSTSRLWTEIRERKKYYKKSSRLDGYYRCLDPKSIKQRFFSWFRTFEDSALKFKKDKSLYHAFTNAITTVVDDWESIHYSWEADDIMGQLKNDEWVPFNHLSDGYRGLISLVADLAYRCIKLNPHLGKDVIKETSGVVLIDEIDLHIHPKWQRTIVQKLKNAFPKIQFIVTTHSTFIVQSVRAEEVINLNENVLDHHPSDQTLEQNALYMGIEDIRSAIFEEKEKTATQVLEKINTAQSLEGVEKENLINEIDQLIIKHSNDPAFVAELKFKRLAKLGNSTSKPEEDEAS